MIDRPVDASACRTARLNWNDGPPRGDGDEASTASRAGCHDQRVTTTTRPSRDRTRRRRPITSLEILCAVLLLAVVFQAPLRALLDVPGLRTGSTVFVAVCVQALPFLVLGVLVSGLIAA